MNKNTILTKQMLSEIKSEIELNEINGGGFELWKLWEIVSGGACGYGDMLKPDTHNPYSGTCTRP